MTLGEKIIFGAVVVVVAIAAMFAINSLSHGNGSTPNLGAVGNLKAENYIPYIRLNGGYNSADPITTSGALTSGALTAAAATFSGDVTVTTSNTATSTATVGCIQTYATSTATPVAIQLGTANEATTTFSGTAYGSVVWQFGSCPL